jgi:hypothetical protein
MAEVDPLLGSGAVSKPLSPGTKKTYGPNDSFFNSLRAVFNAEMQKMQQVPGMPNKVLSAKPEILANQNLSNQNVSSNISKLV